MKAFHILDRELHVRARRRFTFTVRVAVAAVAMLLALSWFQSAAALGNPAEIGRMVFQVLAWVGFGFCLLEGARQTADVISAERREGTLGLLFLTDLRGLDVVLGKLVAASLHSLYGLLAAFPVLGIALVAGGITAGEFWRTQFALITTLALASSAGLWVSARSHDDARSVLGSLGVVIGLTLVPLLIDAAGRGLLVPSLSPAAGLWFASDTVYRVSAERFWWTQAAVGLMTVAFLGGAGWRTARAWRDEPVFAARNTARPAREAWNYRITPRLHARPPLARLETNPAAWLASRPRGLTALVWLAVGLPLMNLLFLQFVLRFFASPMVIGGVLSFLQIGIEVLSLGLLAFVAARAPAQARRDGALELLFCTPLPATSLVRGYWQVYWRRLRLPVALYALVPLGLYLLFWMAAQPGRGVVPWGYLLWAQVPRVVTDVVQMIAAGWLGLWFGLAAPSLGHAVGRTLAAVALAPWLIGLFVATLLRAVLGTSLASTSPSWTLPLWMSGALAGVLWLLGAIHWARQRLFLQLREAVTSGASVAKVSSWRTRWWSMKST